MCGGWPVSEDSLPPPTAVRARGVGAGDRGVLGSRAWRGAGTDESESATWQPATAQAAGLEGLEAAWRPWLRSRAAKSSNGTGSEPLLMLRSRMPPAASHGRSGDGSHSMTSGSQMGRQDMA